MGTEKEKEEDKQNTRDKRNEEGFVGEELEEYEDPLPLQEAIEEYIKGETRTAIGAGSPILAPFYENKGEGESNAENAEASIKETESDVEAPQETTTDVKTTQDLQLRDQKIARKTKKSGGIKGFFHKVTSWFTQKFKKEPKAGEEIPDLTDIPDSINECAITLKRMIKETKKSSAQLPLREADVWVRDLIRYLRKPVNYEAEDYYQATITTLMSMFGYVESNLRMAVEAFQIDTAKYGKKGEKWRKPMAEIQRQLQSFAPFKGRVPGYARALRERLLAANVGESLGENPKEPTVCLLDIVKGAKEDIKTFTINGQNDRLGGQASEVLKVKKDGDTFFFKEDEIRKDIKTAAAELLPILKDPELEEKLKGFFDEFENSGYEAIMQLRDAMEFMQEDGSILDVSWDEMKALMKNHHDAWGDLQVYLLSEKKENWLHFVAAMKKVFVTLEVTLADVELDKGANMTARNFASEQVAELLDLTGIIIHNSEAYVTDENGKKKKGFVMDQAKGLSADDLIDLAVKKDFNIHFTEAAQKQLINLQILDNITGQSDRHKGNYFLDYDEEYDEQKKERYFLVKGIVGIDNDFAFGKEREILGRGNTGSVLQRDKIHKPADLSGKKKKGTPMPPMVTYQYLPGMLDRKTYESLVTLTPELLVINLENVIEPQYLEPLKSRYQIMRDTVIKAKKEADEQKIDFFREKTGRWDREAERELQEKFFGGYLTNILMALQERKERKKLS